MTLARQRGSLRLAVSCSLSAASLAKGELGSTGRSRSRGDALEANSRCDGPPSGRLSRPPLSRPPLSRPPANLPSNLPLGLSPSRPLPAKRSREERPLSSRGSRVGAPSAPVPLACGALAGLVGGRRRLSAFRGRILTALMAMTAAVMTRPPLFRPAAGPPDLHHFGSHGRGFGAGVDHRGIGSCSRLGFGFHNGPLPGGLFWRGGLRGVL